MDCSYSAGLRNAKVEVLVVLTCTNELAYENMGRMPVDVCHYLLPPPESIHTVLQHPAGKAQKMRKAPSGSNYLSEWTISCMNPRHRDMICTQNSLASARSIEGYRLI